MKERVKIECRCLIDRSILELFFICFKNDLGKFKNFKHTN